ncbi:hypothetical protein [Streptomyces sp. NPDC012510]|uniref:hypothetical protein n=1 Tax=Streptomyces sp. NPDC012510 TaxID=3364838 RepID=UPI0036EAB6FA
MADITGGPGNACMLALAAFFAWVFHGMAIALALVFLCALTHPGTRATADAGTPERVSAHR